MKRGRIPLTALRSFEAAGRLENFTLAAEELFVSQAAISRQVRDLEDNLGTELFERLHRRVKLTASGQKLLSVLTRSFDEIDVCLTDITQKHKNSTLTISVEPSFASCWLVQRLADFRAQFPSIDLILDSDHRVTEFRADEAEVAIRFSAASGSWSRTQSQLLFESHAVPVISSQLLQSGTIIERPCDLLQFTLLHEENRIDWEKWFETVDISASKAARGPIYTDSGLVMQAAVGGQGVAIIDKILAMDEINSGRLEQPFSDTISYGAYFLVTRDFARLSEPATIFCNWLRNAISNAININEP